MEAELVVKIVDALSTSLESYQSKKVTASNKVKYRNPIDTN